MKKDEKENGCKRALKFLGFQISDESGILICTEKNERVLGLSEASKHTFSGFDNKDMDAVEKFLRFSRRFWIIKTNSHIEWCSNPFWRCSSEEMAIKLDLIA